MYLRPVSEKNNFCKRHPNKAEKYCEDCMEIICDEDIKYHEYHKIIDTKIKEGRNDISKEKYLMLTVRKNSLSEAELEFTAIDVSLNEAARDLGADGRKAFLRVTLPLSMPGIVSGVSMVFLPAMTNYVVLDMLYNSTYIMGSLIGSYFNAYNWHGGSMIALVLLGIICAFTLLTDSGDEDTRTGGALL